MLQIEVVEVELPFDMTTASGRSHDPKAGSSPATLMTVLLFGANIELSTATLSLYVTGVHVDAGGDVACGRVVVAGPNISFQSLHNRLLWMELK